VKSPDGDGLILAREVGQRFPHIPVFVISGYTTPIFNLKVSARTVYPARAGRRDPEFARAA
jgi:hypothetical protein